MASKEQGARAGGAVRSGKRSRRKTGRKPSSRNRLGLWTRLPDDDTWSDWVSHLDRRRQPVPLNELVRSGSAFPLLWALPDGYQQTDRPRLLKQLTKLAGKQHSAPGAIAGRLDDWLDTAPGRVPDSLFALECLGWAHGLPRLAATLTPDLWRTLFTQLNAIVRDTAALNLSDIPLPYQILRGELPLTLAYLFPEFGTSRELQRLAARTLSKGVVELTDGAGMLHADNIEWSRPLLACWTRAALISDVAGCSCFNEAARNQYQWMIQQTLRLTRSDGTQVFSDSFAGDWCPDLFAAALTQSSDPEDREIAHCILPGKLGKGGARKRRKLPSPFVYSEWAETCVMRTKWSRKSPQFALTFDRGTLTMELSNAGQVLWSGDTTPQVRIAGKEHKVQSDWIEICTFSDEDVDYLELEADYGHQWRVQRQMLLARTGTFFFMADAVLGPRSEQIEYDLTLSLADEVTFERDEPTWDGLLGADRPLATVLPLALPEWQKISGRGRLATDGQTLRLSQAAAARRLYAPVFFDLSPKRLLEKRTWRPLTVAEQLEIQPPDVAVGYRVQSGRSQWMIYRALADRANRSLLGQNIFHEFVFAKFDTDGLVQELIEIE